MLKTILPPALIVALLGPMAACSDIKGAIDFSQDRDDFESRFERLDRRYLTTESNVPLTDSSTYTGEAMLAAGTDIDGVVLIGDASMTIDWDNNTVDGALRNFGGFDRERSYSDYSGPLTLETGVLGVESHNDLESQILGTLSGEDYTIDVDARWQGDLRGNPVRGVLGETTPFGSRFELNGTPVAGGIMIAVGG